MSTMDRYHDLVFALRTETFQMYCKYMDELMGSNLLDTDQLRKAMSFALQVQCIHSHCSSKTIVWPYQLDEANFHYAAHYICYCDKHDEPEEWTTFWLPTELEAGLF